MIQFAVGLVLLVVGVILFAKWHNSPTIEKFTDNLTYEESHETKETDELISDAEQADEALDKRVEDNEKVIKKIQTDTESINTYQKGEADEINQNDVWM